MVAIPLRWAYFALPAPAKRAVRAARQRVRTPKAQTETRDTSFSEQELSRFAEVLLYSNLTR